MLGSQRVMVNTPVLKFHSICCQEAFSSQDKELLNMMEVTNGLINSDVISALVPTHPKSCPTGHLFQGQRKQGAILVFCSWDAVQDLSPTSVVFG